MKFETHPFTNQRVDHFLSKDHHHFTFSSNREPVLHALPHERICVETFDCFGGLLKSRHDIRTVQLDRSKMNPVTGPIHIDGAEPGDILAVTLHDIMPQPGSRGIARCGTSFGQLAHTVSETHYRFFRLDTREDGSLMVEMEEEEEIEETSTQRVHMDGEECKSVKTRPRRRLAPISFPAKPMVGVIGVAPRINDEGISTMPAGCHGGNLDNNLNGIGCTIYLHVQHHGALLSVGDMHAAQGDGEICGTGVEVGGFVLLSCSILKRSDWLPRNSLSDITFDGESQEETHDIDSDMRSSSIDSYSFPITETETSWITHGVVLDDIPQSTVVACEEASKILQQQWCFTPEEAYIFLGVCGDLGLCQSNHPDRNNTPIAKMVVPKTSACPRPFRCLTPHKK